MSASDAASKLKGALRSSGGNKPSHIPNDAADEERQGLLSSSSDPAPGRSSYEDEDGDDERAGRWSRAKVGSVAGALILLILGASLGSAWYRGRDGPRGHDGGELRSNGTHEFKRTVLMVSIDGLRADYLKRGLTPHLLDISKKGLRAEYMQPIFPTLTFPNHWALLTGLYAESHGIVANDFWDLVEEREFHYSSPKTSWNASWWLGEPIWETAHKAGMVTANLMWPGPPTTRNGVSPSIFIPWRNHAPLSEKLAQITSWLDLPHASERPQLITAYEPSVDQAGHETGPNSQLVNDTLRDVDAFARGLTDALDARNLSDIVDVVFVSDHGMTDTSAPHFVYLDAPDLLGDEGWAAVTHVDGWPSMGLRFDAPEQEERALRVLRSAAAEGKYDGMFEVYTRETMPARWHFSNNERIAPVYVIPKIGYALTHKVENGEGMSKGNHGYDNADQSMRAMFVAHGPFARKAKDIQRLRRRGTASARHEGEDDGEDEYVMPGFKNVEIYNLVMSLLGVKPRLRAPNNGTAGFWERYLEE